MAGLSLLSVLVGCACREEEAALAVDEDLDGFTAGDDCDDADPAVHPGADDLCNGLDDDCNGAPDDDPSRWPLGYRDMDGDGYGGGDVSGCDVPVVTQGGDCDDTNDLVHPGGAERCNDVDDDCDLTTVAAAEGAGATFPTIQDAVDAALPGATVFVCDGTYAEEVRIAVDLVLASKNGPEVTTLDGGNARVPIRIGDGAQVTIDGLTIRDGWNAADGGAVDASTGGLLSVSGCVFELNTANRGGAIAATSLVVADSTFRSNKAKESGGAVWIESGTLSVSRSTFEANFAGDPSFVFQGYGGAIRIDEGQVDLTDCTFDSNSSTWSGGAMLTGTASLTLVRSTLVDNSSNFGGALTSSGISVADADTLFEGNVAATIFQTGSGGAVLVQNAGSPASWTGGTFRQNSATGGGGSIAAWVSQIADGTGLIVSEVVVEQSTSYGGGGVHLNGPGVALRDSVVSGNTGELGGGVYVGAFAEAELARVEVVDNTATPFSGAAIYAIYSDLVLDHCTVTGNVAAEFGGAVQLEASTLVSTETDYGSGASANAPDDVHMGSVAGVGSYDYDLQASFSCDSLTSTCL